MVKPVSKQESNWGIFIYELKNKFKRGSRSSKTDMKYCKTQASRARRRGIKKQTNSETD